MKKIIVIAVFLLFVFQAHSESNIQWDQENCKTILLQNGGATIEKGGVYELTGELKNGMVRISVDSTRDTGVVYLVLNNASLEGKRGSPLYIEKAEKVVIIVADGSKNSITYTANEDDDDDLPDAALYSRAPLEITGTGFLDIHAPYVDALKSKKSLTVEDVTLNIATGEDAIDSDGDIEIHSGTFEISAGDDAIHSEKKITIHSGKIDIVECVEGIEGEYVTINDGDIRIVTTDDGMNAPESYSDLVINGGNIYIETHGEDTDGIDSNGNLTITGGKITIKLSSRNRMGSYLDYDGTLSFTGGEVVDENGAAVNTERRRHRR